MELWEQRKGERAKAFYLFTIYRDLGRLRSLEKVPPKYNELTGETISIGQVTTYSAKHGWVERSHAYDRHQDEIVRLEREEAIKEMEHRHAHDTAVIQDAAMKVLNDPQVQAGGLEPSKLAWIVQTVANAYEKAGGFERLTLGETTEYVANKIDGEMKHEVKVEESVFDKVKKAKKLIEEQEG